MSKRALTFALVFGLVLPLSAGPSALDPEITDKIRRQENAGSELMRAVHFLTDVYGPRLTGSPNARDAGEWARKTMAEWGLSNAHLESWDFGHQGWTNERVSAFVISPVKDQLIVEVLAWTPGTNGTVTAPAFQLVAPDRPTEAMLSSYLDEIKGQVKGRIVLAGKTATVPVNLAPGAPRRDEERLRQRYDPDAPVPAPPARSEGQTTNPRPLTRVEISRRIDEFLVSNGALVRINDAGRELGQIVAFHNSTFDPSKVVPTLVMRNEDYGRLSRILADGTVVELEVNIVNRLHPEGRTAYNVVAEIEGSDNGTGRARGASVFGPPAAAAVIREALAPLADLGLVGAAATNRRALGSTDSASFNAAGLPGINFEQDPIQYESATHHTNLDTF